MRTYDEYCELTRTYKTQYGESTVVLMEIGKFYELYDGGDGGGADVKRLCELLNLQMTRKNKSNPQVSRGNPAFSGIPNVALAKYVPVLLEDGWTVVVVSQVPGGAPGQVTRAVTEVISRTTQAASSIVTPAVKESDAENLMVVLIEASSNFAAAGWAVVDLSTGRSRAGEAMRACERAADARLAWDELHAQVSIADPREVLVIGPAMPDYEAFAAHVGLSGRHVHNRTGSQDWRRCTQVAFQSALLKKVFKRTGFLSPAEYVDLECKPHALAAFVAALQFAYDHNEKIVSFVSRPAVMGDGLGGGGGLAMCHNALRQLDVVGPAGTTTLLRLLNRCATPMGKRAFRDRLLRPMSDPDALSAAYDKVDRMLIEQARPAAEARKLMQPVGDLERAFRRVVLGRTAPCELPLLVASIEAACSALRSTALDGQHASAALAGEAVRATIASRVDLSLADRFSWDDLGCMEMFFVQGQHPDLDDMHSELSATYAQLLHVQSQLNRMSSAEHVRVDWSDVDGAQLVVTARRFQGLANMHPGAMLTVSVQGTKQAVKLTDVKHVSGRGASSPGRLQHVTFDALNDRLLGLRSSFVALLKERFASFLYELAEAHVGDLGLVSAAVADLDVTCTCAVNALDMRHSRPSVRRGSERAFLRATGMRHPIIESIRQDTPYVPNDVALGCDGTAGMLLYGVNAVGKSSAMKAAGICVLMAQAGMFVPCEAFELAPFTKVLTRIGLHDDMQKGHSTFMCEMLELRNILRQADPWSLVIGDELCAGTESASALSIVGASLDLLVKRSSAFVFATHLHELTQTSAVRALLERDPGLRVFHLSVTFVEATGRIVFDRKMRPGQGLGIYGLEVLKGLDMDPAFMAAADALRREVTQVPDAIMRPKKSRYNAHVYVDVCGLCGAKAAEETHHIRQQAEADDRGFIGAFHKNRAFNLVPVCHGCHDLVHSGKVNIEGYAQTCHGIELLVR
jgi:DNA mismatch repair protein MutS